MNYAYFVLLITLGREPELVKYPDQTSLCIAHLATPGSTPFGVRNDLEDSLHERIRCLTPVVIDPPKPEPYTDYPIEKDK